MFSAAVDLAVDELNEMNYLPFGHNLRSRFTLFKATMKINLFRIFLSLTFAETYGSERESILATADLWRQNVSALIGPQETCLHEARMAASFNLPMISHYCSQHEPSNKVYTYLHCCPARHNYFHLILKKWPHRYNFHRFFWFIPLSEIALKAILRNFRCYYFLSKKSLTGFFHSLQFIWAKSMIAIYSWTNWFL